MGMQTVVYGMIQEPWFGTLPHLPSATTWSDGEWRLRPEIRARNRLLWKANRCVIRELPLHDEWPWLERGMFAMPRGRQLGRGKYRCPIIHFAGSYNTLLDEWEVWLDKFERLLRALYWETVEVRLVTAYLGNYTYRWEAAIATLDQMMRARPTPVSDWIFDGGPRSFG